MDAASGSSAPADELFPELAAERAHLAHARRARDRMVERLTRVDPLGAADEITAEYVEMTVAEALADLAAPGAGDFFGRIDTVETTRGAVRSERWYIGRRHIEDDDHEPMVVDWRAPVSAPFYRATAADALGVSLRRRFTLERGGQAASFRGEVPVRPEARDELRGPLNERGGQAASFRGEVPVRPEARDELRGSLNERGGQAASFRGEVPVRPEARDELRGSLNERDRGELTAYFDEHLDDPDAADVTAYFDEHLDDPDAADVASGIPDPVLAEIAAARTGAMREIVATIQAEQDVVIRAPIDQVLIVQGGPGTGKTAVALHRAAYLMFEHRRRLARDGVLVIGPNRAFLDYISHVLPSLGERSVRQCTVLDLCVPKVEIGGVDDDAAARVKGDLAMLDSLAAAALAVVTPPADDVIVPIGARRHRFGRDEISEWLARASDSVIPVNERRQRLRAIAGQELLRRTGDDGMWSRAEPLRKALDTAWPAQQPIRLVDRLLTARGLGEGRGRRRRWTPADQLLVDEANSILNGPPLTYGHVVVDEAQDHSAVALRVIGRRSRPALGGAAGASLTLVGDVAQSTTPAGQERWDDVFVAVTAGSEVPCHVAELTIGYRVPEPILALANGLLPLTGVDATASRSVRGEGRAPWWTITDETALGATVGAVVAEVKHRHRLTGVVAPPTHHRTVARALGVLGLSVVDHVHDLGPGDVPLFSPEQVKGLEFDGVVVVAPDEIQDGTNRGARLLYVAITRAVQELAFVTTGAAHLAL